MCIPTNVTTSQFEISRLNKYKSGDWYRITISYFLFRFNISSSRNYVVWVINQWKLIYILLKKFSWHPINVLALWKCFLCIQISADILQRALLPYWSVKAATWKFFVHVYSFNKCHCTIHISYTIHLIRVILIAGISISHIMVKILKYFIQIQIIVFSCALNI